MKNFWTVKILLSVVAFHKIESVGGEKFTTNWTADELANAKNSNFAVANQLETNEAFVRFCCDDKSACSQQEFLNLNSSSQARHLDPRHRKLKGRPDCNDMYQEVEAWEFLPVSRLENR